MIEEGREERDEEGQGEERDEVEQRDVQIQMLGEEREEEGQGCADEEAYGARKRKTAVVRKRMSKLRAG